MYNAVIKRTLDFLAALMAIVLLLPLFLVLFVAIKLDSSGPVFFRQTRSGVNRTPFTILKFRTMYASAPKNVPTYLLNDISSHITRLGRFMRKTSLDELPQLFNILQGKMSFIGPRPVQPMEEDILSARDLVGANAVRPGLSGLAQINGRDELRNEQKTYYDGIYTARLGFAIDVQIFFKTIGYVLTRKGYNMGKQKDATESQSVQRSIPQIVEDLRREHLTNGAPTVRERVKTLKHLRVAIKMYQLQLLAALKADFNKCRAEGIITELYGVLHELNHFIKHLRRYAKPTRARNNLSTMPSKARILKKPYGVVLVMSPWNYPFQLTLAPLIAAYAAGNRVVVKPSNYTPETSKIIERICLEAFDINTVAVVLGGREQNAGLLNERFDYIFFTGGETVGRLVMESAAKNLTPLTLELGGKSPCIIDSDANIELAAKRIAWGKFLNAGQTCVAPDYILAHESVVDHFTDRLIHHIKRMYYTGGALSAEFPYVITDKHLERLKGYLSHSPESVVFGGKNVGRQLEPSVLRVTREHPSMQEEIFGAVLPVLTFKDLDYELALLSRLNVPLAFYYFTDNSKKAQRVMREARYGGGCVNDVILHVSSTMPFGGLGSSGMGAYHGKKSFNTFTHEASTLFRGRAGLSLMYPPYTKKKTNTISRFL